MLHLSCQQSLGQARRWFIINQHREYWTGTGFTRHKSQARLYESLGEAKDIADQIMAPQYEGKRLIRYIAPVYVDLRCDEELSPHDVAHWLSKHSHFILDIPKDAPEGPLDDSYSTIAIEWSELQKQEED